MNRFPRWCPTLALPIVIASVLVPGLANACSAPIDLFDPLKSPSDAIARGVAIDRTGGTFDAKFTIKVVEAVVGEPPLTPHTIDYRKYNQGTCGFSQPLPNQGDDLVLYFSRDEGGALNLNGWQVNPFSDNGLRRRNDNAILWNDRRKKYYVVNKDQEHSWSERRAISVNDPREWITLADPPVGSFVKQHMFDNGNDEEFLPYIVIEFDVTDAGKAANCKATVPGGPNDLGPKACELLVQRARLVPPVFPEERKGIFLFRPSFKDVSTAKLSCR